MWWGMRLKAYEGAKESLLVGCAGKYDNSYESNREIYKHFMDDMMEIEMSIGDYRFRNNLGVGTYDTGSPFCHHLR